MKAHQIYSSVIKKTERSNFQKIQNNVKRAQLSPGSYFITGLLTGPTITWESSFFRYVSRLWFTMDVASTVPLQSIYRIFTGKKHGGDIFGFLNFLRLWRLRRVSNLFARYALLHECILFFLLYS